MSAEKIIVVGSGASGVHFALSLLQKNYQVTMLDVGFQRPPVSFDGNLDFSSLRSKLKDPVDYFLGSDFEAVVYPNNNSEYYAFPPNKKYVFSHPHSFTFGSSGFSPLFSFAQGGLAEVWTGGVYPLHDDDLYDFPFSYEQIEPYYASVAKRIGISGAKDDLTRFLPYHDHIMKPLALDQHSNVLLSKYYEKRNVLNKKYHFYMGRSRLAALSRDLETRQQCTYSGRCIWGCPGGALYTPSLTLEECKTYPNFTYIPNIYVRYFKFNSKRRLTNVVGISTTNGASHEFPLDKLILAAGTLSSSRIFLESIYWNRGEIAQLHGLMDNRQILIPFLNLNMLGKSYIPESYQYHQIAMGVKQNIPKEYVHGQITTLKAAVVHPIIQKIPFDFRTSTFMFRNLRSGLGLINLNFSDHRRNCNYVTINIDRNSSRAELFVKYVPKVGEEHILSDGIKIIKKAMIRLGCVVPPKTIHVRPMGSSVHYSGTIPMSLQATPLTTSTHCQSHDFPNLFIVDGSTLPFLPAKNLTLTLMANAVRVADQVF